MRCLTSAMNGVGTAEGLLVVRKDVLWSVQDRYVPSCLSLTYGTDDCAAISFDFPSNELMELVFFIDPISSYPFIDTSILTLTRPLRIGGHNGNPSHLLGARPAHSLPPLVGPLLAPSFYCPLILPPVTHPRSLPSEIHQYPALLVGLEQQCSQCAHCAA